MNASKYRASAIALLVGAANVVAITTAGTAAAANGPTLVPFVSWFMPNTRYTARLIQVPRASARTCTAGDPGVAVGELFTDGSGTGSTRLQGPLMEGATGAWVSIDGPPKPGRVIGEFYTSEILAAL